MLELLIQTLATQEPRYMPDTYAILCQSEEVAGFEDDSSTAQQLPARQWIFSAQPQNDCFERPREPQPIGTIYFRRVCLTARLVGHPTPAYGHWCMEIYNSSLPEPLVDLTCDLSRGFADLSLSGAYSMAILGGEMNFAAFDGDRAIWVEKGQCTQIV